jgi:valyl-tRNA synthetase
MEAIIAVRRAKVPVDMANKMIAKACIKTSEPELFNTAFIQKLAKVEQIEFVDTKPANAVSDVSENMEVYIPTDSIDTGPIIEKMTKQKEKLEKEAAKLSGMLSNARFIANAPAEVVEENKKAFAELEARIKKVDEELKSLS